MAVDAADTALPAWPNAVGAQYVALCAALARTGRAGPTDLARQFRGVRAAKLAPMLGSLGCDGPGAGGRYVAQATSPFIRWQERQLAHKKPNQRPAASTARRRQPTGSAGGSLQFSGCCRSGTDQQLTRWTRRGGAERDRTADLLIANEALSQLSYSPAVQAADNAQAGQPSQAGRPHIPHAVAPRRARR